MLLPLYRRSLLSPWFEFQKKPDLVETKIPKCKVEVARGAGFPWNYCPVIHFGLHLISVMYVVYVMTDKVTWFSSWSQQLPIENLFAAKSWWFDDWWCTLEWYLFHGVILSFHSTCSRWGAGWLLALAPVQICWIRAPLASFALSLPFHETLSVATQNQLRRQSCVRHGEPHIDVTEATVWGVAVAEAMVTRIWTGGRRELEPTCSLFSAS